MEDTSRSPHSGGMRLPQVDTPVVTYRTNSVQFIGHRNIVVIFNFKPPSGPRHSLPSDLIGSRACREGMA
jgi:hypothetical protein